MNFNENFYVFKIISEAFSAIIYTGALVFPETIFGIIDASTTRRFFIPCTLSSQFTTAIYRFPFYKFLQGDKPFQQSFLCVQLKIYRNFFQEEVHLTY